MLSSTFFFFFQTNRLLPSALLFPNDMEISQPPRCQTPKCHLLQAGEKQVPALNKSRLALTGSSGVIPWTEFAEDQSQCEQRGLSSQKFPLHSIVFAGNGSNFSAAEPKLEVWGILVLQGVEWAFVPLLQRFQLPHHCFSSALSWWWKHLKLTKPGFPWTSLLENVFSFPLGSHPWKITVQITVTRNALVPGHPSCCIMLWLHRRK